MKMKAMKHGYAFKKAPKEDVCIYIGHHPEDKDRVFFYNRTKGWFDWTNKDNLTRAPEHDLKEVKSLRPLTAP